MDQIGFIEKVTLSKDLKEVRQRAPVAWGKNPQGGSSNAKVGAWLASRRTGRRSVRLEGSGERVEKQYRWGREVMGTRFHRTSYGPWKLWL